MSNQYEVLGKAPTPEDLKKLSPNEIHLTIKNLKNVGGQSPIEAAKFGCKIYHGPYVYNFEEIYKILEVNNISKEVENFEDLSKNLVKDLENPTKRESQNSQSINNLAEKTLADNMKLIENFISDEVI